MKIVYLSSTSPTKLSHFSTHFSKLGIEVKGLKLEIPELQIMSCSAVARAKLQMAKDLSPLRPLLVDDVGLEINGLRGFPGAFLKPILEQGGLRLLRDLAHAKLNDSCVEAQLTCAIALTDGAQDFCVEGSMPGRLDFTNETYFDDTQTIRCFYPADQTQSIAELQLVNPEAAYQHRFSALAEVSRLLSLR